MATELKEELKFRMLERRVRKGIMDIFPSPQYSKQKSKQPPLSRFKTDSRASIWKYTAEIPERGKVNLFIKANRVGESALEFRTQAERTRAVSSTHADITPVHYGIYTLLGNKDILPGFSFLDAHYIQDQLEDDVRLLKLGIVRNRDIDSDSIVLEVTELIAGMTIAEILENNKMDRHEPNDADKDILGKLCETFIKLHRPLEEKELGISRKVADVELARLHLYNESLEKIQDRARTYLPLEEDHPLLTKGELGLISGFGAFMRQDLWSKVELFRHNHGDAQAKNCLLQAPVAGFPVANKIYLLDWGRITKGPYVVDWGRFICDLIWRYEMDSNPKKTPYILNAARYLIEKCTELYKAPEFRRHICMGVFSLTCIRLSKSELRGLDLKRVQGFRDRILDMLHKKEIDL